MRLPDEEGMVLLAHGHTDAKAGRHSRLSEQADALHRQAQPEWKKGFYYIALKAEIPILLYGVDFKDRHIVCTKTIVPNGDIEAQMQEIKEYYSNFKGLHPDKFKV